MRAVNAARQTCRIFCFGLAGHLQRPAKILIFSICEYERLFALKLMENSLQSHSWLGRRKIGGNNPP